LRHFSAGFDRPDRHVLVPQPGRAPQAVEAQIRAVTGLDLVITGAIDVSVFPGSYVSFHDVGLKGGGTIDPALQVDVLTANLRLLPLLLRRFEIADVMMLRPHIRVVRDGNGESNWTPFVDTIARAMKPGAENQVSFSEIRIQDGVLNYEDPTNHVSEKCSAISTCRWPGLDLALLCRDRAVRLARRARRRLDQLCRFRRALSATARA
jgi:Uncharacterized protein involved in outer membrane biogenesis